MDWTLPPAWHQPSITQDGRTIHQLDDEGKLTAFDAATGAVRWAAKRPPSGAWTWEESYADGVVAMYGSGASTGVCRFDGAGVRRWCAPLDRQVFVGRVGRTRTGLSVVAEEHATLVLDPATGATLIGWPPSDEPDGAVSDATTEVVGTFGRVTVVVDSRSGTVAGYRRGAVAWTLSLDEPAALLSDGLSYDSLGFEARTGSSFAVVRVGPELIGITADGRLAWHQTAPLGRVVVVGTRLALVSDQDARGLDPANGAERWRTPIDGIGAVEGELGDLVVLGQEHSARDVVWVDPATGQITARTPLGGRAGTVTSIPGRLLAVARDGEQHRSSVLARDGAERWSMAGGLELHGSVGIRSDTDELVDLGTGAVLGPTPGLGAASVGGTLLRCGGWGAGCDVTTIPQAGATPAPVPSPPTTRTP